MGFPPYISIMTEVYPVYLIRNTISGNECLLTGITIRNIQQSFYGYQALKRHRNGLENRALSRNIIFVYFSTLNKAKGWFTIYGRLCDHPVSNVYNEIIRI